MKLPELARGGRRMRFNRSAFSTPKQDREQNRLRLACDATTDINVPHTSHGLLMREPLIRGI